jgi:hypothetical protein
MRESDNALTCEKDTGMDAERLIELGNELDA